MPPLACVLNIYKGKDKEARQAKKKKKKALIKTTFHRLVLTIYDDKLLILGIN
jgi:hypothetical protein